MGNVIMEATQINYRRDEKLKTVDQKLQELSQESAIDTDIAPVFKSNITYHPGDMVYYRNKLYVFTAEHTGAWAAGDVTATDVSTAMNTALSGKSDYADIAGAFSSETAYTAGDLVIYNGIIYRCTNDHTGEWDADDFSATTIGAEINAINSNIANKSIICDSLVTGINSTAGSWNLSIALSTDKKLSDYDLFVFNRYKLSSTFPVGVSYFVTKDIITSSSGGYPIKLIDGTGYADSFYVACVDDTHICAYMGASIDSDTVFCLYGIKLS